MSASGFTPISLYYSTTAAAVPTAANLVPGELAINTADGKLYYEDSAGVVQVLATKSTGSIGGSNTQVQFNNSGSLGGSSSFTWDGTTVTATKFAGALNGTVGATTASTGAFTTLTSNGATTFTAGTASTSTTTGTTVITGGLGVSGRINAANFDGIVGANTAAAGSFTTLSATGVATFSAGTVSLPAITTTGDTNTGIYFPAADTIAFTEGGAESMRISDTGNVGIGTTSPSQKLQVVGNALISSGGWFGFGDADERISADNTGFMQFFVNASERIRIDSSGNVGIATTSPTQKLQVAGNVLAANAGWFGFGDADERIVGDNTGSLQFFVSGSERMRIDSSGNVGIGTSSPSAKLDVSSSGNTELSITSSGSTPVLSLISTGTSVQPIIAYKTSTGAALRFGTVTGAALAGYTTQMILNADGNVGIGSTSPGGSSTSRQLTLQGTTAQITLTTGSVNYNSGINASNVAYLEVSGANPLTFYTNSSERMRIDSSGRLLVGTTTAGAGKITSSDGAQINAIDNYNGNANITCGSSVDTTGGIYVKFLKSDASNVGTITRSGSNSVGYNSVSDYRLKTVIGSVTNAGQRIDALEPIEYDWNTGGRARGFLAHKFSEIYPNSVSGEKDAVDADGKPIYQTMQASTSEVMADLIAEIQSLRQRITTLENK